MDSAPPTVTRPPTPQTAADAANSAAASATSSTVANGGPYLHVVHLPNAAPVRRKSANGPDTAPADAGTPAPQTAPRIVPQIIWAHGWMHTHANLLPLANTCTHGCDNYLLDMPGFGRSGMPPATWGTQDYADHAAAWLRTLPRGRRIWVGHSFGCRVGLQLAARHPDLLDGLFLMAAAGLPRRRTPTERFTRGCRIAAFKTLKHLNWLGFGAERVRRFFGSADYANAGPLRPVFVSVVNENLSDVAARVACPVHLLYGENDTETPPSMGQDFARLLPHAHLQVLPRFGHLDILTAGGHQAVYALDTFCEEIFGG
uniref:Alpha/beta hydrolase fold protein n=1 Tax=Nitratidesulfovibrio vulgaris (strain DSM 19637 / Miyazaki F) TaxID=883 RepID=B8DLD5_NITV9